MQNPVRPQPWKAAFDARDSCATELRGWGRYARDLLAHLPAARVVAYTAPGRGPEVLWEQLAFPRLARRDGAALLHAPNCFLPLRRGALPGVVTVHDLAFEAFPGDFAPRTRAKYALLTPRAARSAERVLVDGTFTRDDLVERYGVDPGRIRVVPLAPSVPVGSGPVGEGAEYVLAVGDLRAKKNLGRLIAGWEQAGRPVRLVLAGHGRMAVPDGVEVTGYVDDRRLDALLRGAAVLVHPSLYEGFGLVVAEAMARGTPVACSATTALPETAGGAAVLFDPLDPEAIWAGVAAARARAGELRAAGLARAGAWSWERTAAATLAVYEELV